MGARLNGIQEVTGSTPVRSTKPFTVLSGGDIGNTFGPNGFPGSPDMRTSRAAVALPIPVRRALRKLGRDIRDARRRRRIPVEIAAERASISRMTLLRLEKGEPGVAVGICATVLFVLGLADRLADIADPKNDPIGLQLEEEHLPKRIRTPRRPKPARA